MPASGTYSVPAGATPTLTHTHNNGIRMMHAGQLHQQMQVQQQQQQGHHQHVNMTVVPISVTTASHGNHVRTTQIHPGQPVVSMMQQPQRQQTADVRIARSGIIPQANVMHTSSPQSQASPTGTIRVRQGITLSARLAKPGRGITLVVPINKVAQLSHPSAFTRKLLQTAPPRSSPAAPISNNNSVYSSACRASVNAQLQASRRINSAPGNLSAVTTSSQIQQQGGKYKYTKVVGGKQAVPRSASMVRLSESLSLLSSVWS
jgi:hypothetical protein